MGSIPGLGQSPGGGHGNPLQYSGLENALDRGAWWVIVHGVAESDTTGLLNNNFAVAQMVRNLPALWETLVQSVVQEDPLEEEMATHSSILAWRIPRTEEPGGLQSIALQRVGHD